MNRIIFEIEGNACVAKDIFRMELRSEEFPGMRCGQFVDIALDGRFLRRPISVCHSEKGRLVLLYKLAGAGTRQMSDMAPGRKLDILTDLGNGFSLSACSREALLIGGGIGTAPLLQLGEDLVREGKKISVVLGFNTADEIVLTSEFEALGAEVRIATMDGSAGVKGFVTDALKAFSPAYDHYYVCGPLPMEKAVFAALDSRGEYSLEERMGCGTGICYGCSLMTRSGAKRVCKDGPVFKKEELTW